MTPVFALFLTLTIGNAAPQNIVKVLEVSESECEAQRPRVEAEVLTHSVLALDDVNFTTQCLELK